MPKINLCIELCLFDKIELKGGSIMKKFIMLFLISLFLSFNMLIVTSVAETRVLKEGFYRISDLNFLPNEIYTIKNNSFTDRVQVFIFDEDQTIIQSLRLRPQAPKYELQPLQPDYRIAIIGNGEAIISSNTF